MTKHPAEFWQRKARALLVPSPFSIKSADHGEQERARLARVDDILGAAGEDERQLIARCVRDARDAHVPDNVQERAQTWCKRMHPLDKKVLDTTRPGTWFEHERTLAELAGQVQAGDAGGARRAYFRLWQRTMECGDRMPGSFALPDHSIAALRSMSAALMGARADGGRAALLYMHVGPVQGFIKASRRTHDLWVGSYTVGYLVMQAILAIAQAEGPDAIVYPDLAMLPLSQKLIFPETGTEAKDLLRSSLANRFLAVVPHDRAQGLLDRAYERVVATWRRMAAQAQAGICQVAPEHKDMWRSFKEQRDAHLEVDALVQPWPADRAALLALLDRFGISRPSLSDDIGPERTGDGYGALFDLCHRTLTAHRKTSLPAALPGDERPKCSQCGQREQMVKPLKDLKDADDRKARDRPRTYLDRCRAFNQELSKELSNKDRDNEDRRISYQLTRGEGLCAVCWTKRMVPEAYFGRDGSDEHDSKLGLDWNDKDKEDRRLLRFPGVVTIAAAPFRYRMIKPPAKFWERKPGQRKDPFALASKVDAWLRELKPVLGKEILSFTPPGNLLYGLDVDPNGDEHEERKRDPRLRQVAEGVLAHDGEWLYDSNYEPETAWSNHFAHDLHDSALRGRLEHALRPARAAFVTVRQMLEIEASSYYAVLVLDLDDLGKWLTGSHPEAPRLIEMLTDTELAKQVASGRERPLYPALHRELARRLAALAVHLHEIVDRHLGRMVYSGGDDVMAFLPLATALPCTRAIERAMRIALGDRVTASAGLAIAHMRMPLSRTLDDARKAEEKSKHSGKDRLTVRVTKRSGAPVDVAFPWRVQGSDKSEVDVIEALIEVLRRDDQGDGASQGEESARPLSRVDVAYRLEQEFRLLYGDSAEGGTEGDQAPGAKRKGGGGAGSASLDEMFTERMRTLLSTGVGSAMRPRVDRLMICLEKLGGSRDRMNLLLLLRFLMREEHGIDTVPLLQDLEVWPWQDPKEIA